jgi:hypothetical protein
MRTTATEDTRKKKRSLIKEPSGLRDGEEIEEQERSRKDHES